MLTAVCVANANSVNNKLRMQKDVEAELGVCVCVRERERERESERERECNLTWWKGELSGVVNEKWISVSFVDTKEDYCCRIWHIFNIVRNFWNVYSDLKCLCTCQSTPSPFSTAEKSPSAPFIFVLSAANNANSCTLASSLFLSEQESVSLCTWMLFVSLWPPPVQVTACSHS